MKYDLIIIGGGIAGAASALRACQYNLKTLWITGTKANKKRSRSNWVPNIDNMIGIHPSLMLEKIQKKLKDFPEAKELLESSNFHISTKDIIQNTVSRIQSYGNYVEIVEEEALQIEHKEKHLFEVKTNENNNSSRAVIVATGLMDRQPTIYKDKDGDPIHSISHILPYSNAENVLYCIRCEGHLTNKKNVAMIGHSDVAAQIACMLYERYSSGKYIITNGEDPCFNEETKTLINHYGIQVYQQKIKEILGKRGDLKGFILDDGTEIKADFGFVSAGLFQVYNSLIRNLDLELAEGDLPDEYKRVIVDHKGQTKIENLFCIGDMAVRKDEPIMMQVYTAQEYAVRAVDLIDMRRRYNIREAALQGLT